MLGGYEWRKRGRVDDGLADDVSVSCVACGLVVGATTDERARPPIALSNVPLTLQERGMMLLPSRRQFDRMLGVWPRVIAQRASW